MKRGKGRKKEYERKPYVRPEVKQVPLKPEEAVLGFCKTSSGTGPAGGPCRGHGGCQGQGS